MRRSKFDNKTIDTAGRRLIVSRRTPLSEVDLVVGDPQLFTKVKARIAAEQTHDRPVSLSISLWSFTRRHAIVFAVVLSLFVVAAALIVNRIGKEFDVVRSVSPTAVADEPRRAVSQLRPVEKIEVLPTTTGALARSERPRAVKASYRKPILRGSKPQTSKPVLHEDQFYAVSYTGDPAEGDTGGRIVRVEMQRSSLFAMGINLPLENDEGTVKADLLIGRDGSTRAIRVVR